MKKYFHNEFYIIFILVLLPLTNSFAQPSLDEIQAGIDLSISEKYKEAIQHFAIIKNAYPESPAGSFFLAAVWQSMMMDFETKKWETNFYEEINNAIETARRELKNDKSNANLQFFFGGALAYKSFQLARDKKYPAAIKTAIASIKELNKVNKIDTTFCDSYLGIGSYQYWRSRLTLKFSWLPFFPDRRKEGLHKIIRVSKCGRYSKWAALSNLAWIYIEERNYPKAIKCAQAGLARFPDSRFFLWPLGDAQFSNGDYDDASKTYQKILTSVTSQAFNNHYNEILLHYKLGQCYENMGKYQQTKIECEKAIALKASEEVEKRARKKKEDAVKLLAKITREAFSN